MENFLLGFLWGLFGLGYIPYTRYIVFLLLRERGLLIDHQNLVDTRPASSPCIIKTVNLTIINCQSQVGLMHGIAIGGPTARPPRYRRPNRRPFYACCRNQNETVALFCKVNAKRWCLLAEPILFWAPKSLVRHQSTHRPQR